MQTTFTRHRKDGTFATATVSKWTARAIRFSSRRSFAPKGVTAKPNRRKSGYAVCFQDRTVPANVDNHSFAGHRPPRNRVSRRGSQRREDEMKTHETNLV